MHDNTIWPSISLNDVWHGSREIELKGCILCVNSFMIVSVIKTKVIFNRSLRLLDASFM